MIRSHAYTSVKFSTSWWLSYHIYLIMYCSSAECRGCT